MWFKSLGGHRVSNAMLEGLHGLEGGYVGPHVPPRSPQSPHWQPPFVDGQPRSRSHLLVSLIKVIVKVNGTVMVDSRFVLYSQRHHSVCGKEINLTQQVG